MTNPDRDKYETVKLADIQARAGDRPAGYVDDVLGQAVEQDATHVLLPLVAYYALLNKYNPPPIVMARGVATAAPTGFDGSALWALLHAAPAATQDVVDAVTAGLSCGPCRTGWLAMLERTPPPLGDLPAFRVWAWQRHEEVNAKISKPLMTYDQAAARWGWET